MNTQSPTKTLLVVADKQTSTYFKLLGAMAYTFTPFREDWLIDELESILKQVGAVVVDAQVALKANRFIQKVSKHQLPLVTLPSSDNPSAFGDRLETLIEKAVGMKIKIGDE